MIGRSALRASFTIEKVYGDFDKRFRGLLEAGGIGSLPEISPDCMSFRAFAFSFTDNIGECFRPAIEWKEYMEKLSWYLGIGDELTVESCKAFSMEKFPENTWVLFGEFPHCWGIETVQNKFYSGYPAYYLCRKHNETEYLICNPLAILVQIATKYDIRAKMETACGFIAYFNRTPKLNIINPRDVIADAVEWRNENLGMWLENQESLTEKAFRLKRSEKCALSYGLINYQVQVSKVIEFAGSVGCLGRTDHQILLDMLYRLSDILETGGYSIISELDSAIWTKLADWKRGELGIYGKF